MKDLVLTNLIKVLKILLILIDIILNRVFNGRVETISSRASRGVRSRKLWARVLCKILDKVDPGHCEDAGKNPTGGL